MDKILHETRIVHRLRGGGSAFRISLRLEYRGKDNPTRLITTKVQFWIAQVQKGIGRSGCSGMNKRIKFSIFVISEIPSFLGAVATEPPSVL